ncbi:MAG: helix-turn-helix domain-containing protein [Vulcanococcus sp.]
MTTFVCIAATVLALLTVPLLLLYRLTESRKVTARRMRANGWTWVQVGRHLNVSPSTARRWATGCR